MNAIIIIGTGLAGYQLAREFRKYDKTSPLIFVTADDGRFYSKPLLSTALTNKKDFISLTMSTAETMATQLDAKIYTHSRVTNINPQKKTITFDDHELAYSKLILACGATVVHPQITGDSASDTLSVNDIHDYATFQQSLQEKKKITVIGAGLIGCEFANDLSNAGYEVDVVALGTYPLDLLIPAEIGRLLQKSLEENGVRFHFGCSVTTIAKSNDHYVLTLSNGSSISSDLVLSAIGLRPNTHLAEAANIKTNRGIVVNRYLETSEENIFALGDCAEVEGHVLPYITPLLNAARALAKTLANEKTAVDYPAMPVIVKTPAHPIAVCPPPKHAIGQWKIEADQQNVKALFYNQEKQLLGFVLTNDAVKERMALAKLLPNLF